MTGNVLGDNLVPGLHFLDGEPEALEGAGTPQVVGEWQVLDGDPGLLPAHWKWCPRHHAAGDTLVLPAPGSGRKVRWQAGPGLGHGRGSLRLGLLTQALAKTTQALEEGCSEGPLAFPILFGQWLSSFYPTPHPFPPLIPAPAPIPIQSLQGAGGGTIPNSQPACVLAEAVGHLRCQGWAHCSSPPRAPPISVAPESRGYTKPCVRWRVGDQRGRHQASTPRQEGPEVGGRGAGKAG